jgi:nitrate/nitrite-specific signal transduction histidine kinase
MGMQIMRYRAAMIAGTLSVQPGAERGVAVVCSVLNDSAAPVQKQE